MTTDWVTREEQLVAIEVAAILGVAADFDSDFWETLPVPQSPREFWAMVFAGVEAACHFSGLLPVKDDGVTFGLEAGEHISVAELLAMRMICARANGNLGLMADLWVCSPDDGCRELAHGHVIIFAAQRLVETRPLAAMMVNTFDPLPSPNIVL